MRSSTRLIQRLATLSNVWTELRPTKTFAGMTLEQFKAAVGPSLDARVRLELARKELKAALVARDNADQQSAVVVDRLAAAFVAEEEEGYNGVLYAKLGYIRKADRKSGLKRRAAGDAAPAAAPKAG
jgi:hypothetical protein